MKIILLNILFISAIFAQRGLTVVGGLNQSNQTIEEDAEDVDINYTSDCPLLTPTQRHSI